MKNFILSTDAASDLTHELATQYNISVIPMEFTMDGITFTSESEDMSNKQFYDYMRAGSVAHTSQINYENAYAYLDGLLKTGASVLHLTLSSSLSAMIESFRRAADDLDKIYPGKIAVVDSLSGCAGQIILALLAKKKLEECETLQEAKEYAEKMRLHICHVYTVENLKYLGRSGRIHKAIALLAVTIQLKASLYLDDDGKMTVLGKSLKRKKALLSVVEQVVKKFNGECSEIFISHADCLDDAHFVRDEIFDALGIVSHILPQGPVIGAHSGPGTLAVFFSGDDRSIAK